eukprot:m.22138 g.22138  ORF g.22138 m.22138 type:complete len:410 (+) comp11208_c0_seq2:254-1483(+)
MAASSASAPTLSGRSNKKTILSPAKLAQQYNQHAPHSSHPQLEANGYDVHETIGVGGYSKVKLAVHRSTGQKYAVKIISKGKAPAGYLSKFLPREISALRRIKHPNVAGLHDLLDTPDRVYLVMEYAPRGDLLEYINQGGSLSEDEARKLFYQMITAVNYCHGLRVVHRDLKCENMLLDNDLNILVSDFGFATVVPSTSSKLMTHCGSYAYAAPEILTGQPYQGNKSDAWSLGIILFAMTCGRLPYNDKTIKVLMAGIKRKLDFPRRISRELQDFIERILVLDPQWRASVPEMLQHPWMANYAAKQYRLNTSPDVGLALGLISKAARGSPKPTRKAKHKSNRRSDESATTPQCPPSPRPSRAQKPSKQEAQSLKLPLVSDSTDKASMPPSRGAKSWTWRRPCVFNKRAA